MKSHWTDVDMQILSLLGCEYKRGKGSVPHWSFSGAYDQ